MESVPPQGPDSQKANSASSSLPPSPSAVIAPPWAVSLGSGWSQESPCRHVLVTMGQAWPQHPPCAACSALAAAGTEGQGKMQCFGSCRVKSVVPSGVGVLKPPAGLILLLPSHARCPCRLPKAYELGCGAGAKAGVPAGTQPRFCTPWRHTELLWGEWFRAHCTLRSCQD